VRRRLGRWGTVPSLLVVVLITGAGCSSTSPTGVTLPTGVTSPTGAEASGGTVPPPSPTPEQTGSVGPTSAPLTASPGGTLRGKVIAIDPGHNGDNGKHPAQIGRLVDIGNGRKACDTTGTETNTGYPESAFNFDVATRLATALRSAGATVVLTHPDNRGVGPCITERAAIGNRAHADAAVSIHADGAPSTGYGFHVIVPRGIGRNDAIVAPSRRLGTAVRDAFQAGTGEPLSTYTGAGGLVARSDLGGLNLSTVPKVFIECGNMRNASDASRITSETWRQRAALALAAGLTDYLTGSS
jgi:N-acetylmuramoyl-L-alanine amidase